MRKEIRNRILKRFNNKCNYCKSLENLEIDHIIPVSKGGKADEINLQVLCRSCNRKKSNKLDIDKYFIKGDGCVYISRDFTEIMGSLSPNELSSIIDQKLK